jgi:DNA-binding transcriptional MerR regulator
VPTEATYSIADLSRATGVSVRTIRYYLQQGLLPASGETGPGAHYNQGHLDRLRLTKRLQAEHLPLSEIRRRLEELSDTEIADVLAVQQPSTPSGSALEYVRGLLGSPSPAPSFERHQGVARKIVAPLQASNAADSSLGAAEIDIPLSTPAARPPALSWGHPASLERSQWERLSLGPNIELHVRRPLSRIEQKRVERLITIASQVLKEDTP